MQKLEKILEEIEQYRKEASDSGDFNVSAAYEKSMEIIRKHMNDGKCGECSRRKWYQKGFEDGNKNDGWIPVEERLPIPDKEIWVTVKRNGKVFVSTDAMTEKGHFWNYEKGNILAWKEKDPIPEPYRQERSDNHDGE